MVVLKKESRRKSVRMRNGCELPPPNPTTPIVSVGKDGVVIEVGHLVSSKIEHTTPVPTKPTKPTSDSKVQPALAYRTHITTLGKSMYEYVVKLVGGNMLNAKLALWEAIRMCEREMREKGV